MPFGMWNRGVPINDIIGTSPDPLPLSNIWLKPQSNFDDAIQPYIKCMTAVLVAVESEIGILSYEVDFPIVTFTLHLRRKPVYYVVNLIVPCCLLSLIAVATFLLQPGCSERLGIGTCEFRIIHITVVVGLA